MTPFRALGIAWLATAMFSLVIMFVFRTEADGYAFVLVLGVATVALGAWHLVRPSDRAVASSVVTGIAWLPSTASSPSSKEAGLGSPTRSSP